MKFIEVNDTITGMVQYINIETIASMVPTQTGAHTNIYMTNGQRACVWCSTKDLAKALMRLGHEVKPLTQLLTSEKKS